jgi:hypothetical protein
MPAPFWMDKPDKENDLRKAWRLMNGKPEEEIIVPANSRLGKRSQKSGMEMKKNEGAE